jgi:uncharacterized protein YijF (DUF1287 family)
MKSQRSNLLNWLASIVCLSGLLIGCNKSEPLAEENAETNPLRSHPPSKTERANMNTQTSPIVFAARNQIGKTTVYDPSYVRLVYPGGDVAIDRGVCTDVVVRALRDAFNMDLQKRVHEDMASAFSEYPKIWGLTKPDRNIDHRRVPNLRRYFERKEYSFPVTREKADYLPGDLVTCTVPPNRPHIMIVSDRTAQDGVPLVIHNIGAGAREENRLFSFPITGHYRIEQTDD